MGHGKSDSLSATISSTSSVGSSNSPTSTWTGLAPTGSCKRGHCVHGVCTAPTPLCFGDALEELMLDLIPGKH